MGNYVATPYTTAASVKRLLRVANNKITIGDEGSNADLTSEDLDEYILDGSRRIDSMLRKIVTVGKIPLTYTYAEISLAAPRITAFLIYRDLYQGYRREDTPAGPQGWIEDAMDDVRRFIDNIDSGMYSELSASRAGPAWTTVQQLFQTQIGVDLIDDELRENKSGTTAPTRGDNIGPQQSGD